MCFQCVSTVSNAYPIYFQCIRLVRVCPFLPRRICKMCLHACMCVSSIVPLPEGEGHKARMGTITICLTVSMCLSELVYVSLSVCVSVPLSVRPSASVQAEFLKKQLAPNFCMKELVDLTFQKNIQTKLQYIKDTMHNEEKVSGGGALSYNTLSTFVHELMLVCDSLVTCRYLVCICACLYIYMYVYVYMCIYERINIMFIYTYMFEYVVYV